MTYTDAYSHMHHFYSRSTSKKKSVKQERAWELPYFHLLCKFKEFRHHEEVKQVAKIWKKLIFLPEELVPDSSLRKTCPVPVQFWYMCTIRAITFDILIQMLQMGPLWKIDFQGFPKTPTSPYFYVWAERNVQFNEGCCMELMLGKWRDIGYMKSPC